MDNNLPGLPPASVYVPPMDFAAMVASTPGAAAAPAIESVPSAAPAELSVSAGPDSVATEVELAH